MTKLISVALIFPIFGSLIFNFVKSDEKKESIQEDRVIGVSVRNGAVQCEDGTIHILPAGAKITKTPISDISPE
jgi:hypothetical protein